SSQLPALQFSATVQFLSASFSARLSPTSFLIDGTPFMTSPNISAELSPPPSSGPALAPGDFTVLAVSAQPAAVREPSTLLLLYIGLAGLMILKRRSRRNPTLQCTNSF